MATPMTLEVLAAQMAGFQTLVDERTKNMQEDIKELKGLPTQVSNLQTQADDNTKRIDELEKKNEKQDDRSYDRRWVNLPTILFAALSAVIALAAILTQVIH